ncbi:MAG: hypothetical protein QM727_08030 [Niabella sp.]
MTVDEIYELVAVNIINNITEDNWSKAILNIQGDNDYVDLNGKFIAKGTEQNINVHNFDDEVEFALMELHEITTEDGNNKWNRAVFTVTSEGKFDMEFIWDEELNDEIERLAKS